jgi:hypothetical protein
MTAVPWEKLEPYFLDAFAANGQVERQDVIDLAFGEDESDDVIDAIDAIGSRVFRTVDDAKAFLKSRDMITG